VCVFVCVCDFVQLGGEFVVELIALRHVLDKGRNTHTHTIKQAKRFVSEENTHTHEAGIHTQ